jgi:hypothetical protein
VVEEFGGVIQILPYVEDRSTTRVIDRVREAYARDVAKRDASDDGPSRSPSHSREAVASGRRR